MKKEYVYREGAEARQSFEEAMKDIFKARKPVQSAKPKAKKKTSRKSAGGKD